MVKERLGGDAVLTGRRVLGFEEKPDGLDVVCALAEGARRVTRPAC